MLLKKASEKLEVLESLTLEGIRGGGGGSIWPPSIFLALNFCSLTDYQKSKTSFEKNCFSAWASTLNMGLINKVDMVCLSPVGYGV